jgi:DNA-3-methyladenine glycosylase
MRPLSPDFYDRPVLEVARALIGCVVARDGVAGVIVETEAYHESEPACHAFVGLTPRTRTLFGAPGQAYVYRSYGIHALLNAVCEPEGVGAAVLIRALAPLVGVERMRARRGANRARTRNARRAQAVVDVTSAEDPPDVELCSGPGKLSQALAVSLADNATSLRDGPVTIGPPVRGALAVSLVAAPRVGISRAAELPWRFCLAGSPHVSRPRPRAAAAPAAA